MTTTDLVYAGASLRDRQDYALALSKAGDLIPRGLRDPNGQPNPGKILLVTEYGNALHIHPIVAINGIDIIEGNLTITPALMSGLVRERGHKLRVSTDGTGQALTATAELIRSDDPGHPFKVTWSMADAKAAGLDNKSNWKKYPRAMLKARAISEVCREGAEDVLMGAYVPEELGAETNEAGQVIDAEIVEQDHDGPAVSNLMRSNFPDRASTVGKTEARQRDAGDAASNPQRTGPSATGKGRGRPESPAATPTTPDIDAQDRADVANMWIERIRETDTFDTLLALRAEVAKRGTVIFDYADYDGHTVDQWFNRRRNEVLDAAQQAAAGEPEPTITLDSDTSVYDDDSVPF